MLLAATLLITLGLLSWVLIVRQEDLPQTAPTSPVAHLEDRKAAIYENLRDLNFEYRLGKLSDADYQSTKLGLQKELALVLAEIDRILGGAPPDKPGPPAPDPLQCPHCGARFDKPLKFCGECGKPMQEAKA
jgi:hypothetical protein